MLLVINNYVKLLNVCMVVFYVTKINGVFFVKQINLVKYY